MAARTSGPATTEFDMTPMIDVTFQLITFFMFVLNTVLGFVSQMNEQQGRRFDDEDDEDDFDRFNRR